MSVSGTDASQFDAVRLDTMLPINTGPLVSVDTSTGHVEWKDRITGETKNVNVDASLIRIIPKSRLGR